MNESSMTKDMNGNKEWKVLMRKRTKRGQKRERERKECIGETRGGRGREIEQKI